MPVLAGHPGSSEKTPVEAPEASVVRPLFGPAEQFDLRRHVSGLCLL